MISGNVMIASYGYWIDNAKEGYRYRWIFWFKVRNSYRFSKQVEYYSHFEYCSPRRLLTFTFFTNSIQL